jgi:hypothetical protein
MSELRDRAKKIIESRCKPSMMKGVQGDEMFVDEQIDFTIDQLAQLLTTEIKKARARDTSRVNRVELIDYTGRAYVKGEMYGSPVKVRLNFQDKGRTLKIFVEQLNDSKEEDL